MPSTLALLVSQPASLRYINATDEETARVHLHRPERGRLPGARRRRHRDRTTGVIKPEESEAGRSQENQRRPVTRESTEYPCCQGPDRGKGSSASGGESVHSGPDADLYVRWSNVAADPNVTSGERTYRQGSARPCAGLRWPRPANPASGQSLHLPSALYVVHPLWRTRRICTVIDIEVVSQYANAADVTTAQRDVPLRALQARAPTTIVQPPSTLSQLLA